MTSATAARSAPHHGVTDRFAGAVSLASMAFVTMAGGMLLWFRTVPLPDVLGVAAAVLFATLCAIAVYGTLPAERRTPVAVADPRPRVVRPPPPPEVDILKSQDAARSAPPADSAPRQASQVADVERAFANLEQEWHELAALARRRRPDRRVLAA